MKTRVQSIAAVSLLAFCLCFPLVALQQGCATTTQTTTYNTLAATGQLVNGAFTAYMDLVVKGKVPTNSVPTMASAYNDFQQVYGAALTLAQYNPNAVAPSNVVASANTLVSKIALAEGKAP